MIIKDNFLTCFTSLKSHAKSARFKSEQNGVDGAVYPSICFDIPQYAGNEFISSIEKEMGYKIKVNLLFLRSNPLGAVEPYQAHNDSNMGDSTAILYINPYGGTAFVKHNETGMIKNDHDYVNEWERDCNISDKWSTNDYCKSEENRVLIFDSELMHRGEPVEGHGQGGDARMIMVCFYEKA